MGYCERAESMCKVSSRYSTGDTAEAIDSAADSCKEAQADKPGERGELSTDDYAVFSTQSSSPEHLVCMRSEWNVEHPASGSLVCDRLRRDIIKEAIVIYVVVIYV